MALENARRLHWLEQENERLTVEISQDRSLVGDGARMKEVYQFLKRAAPDRFDGINSRARVEPAKSWRRGPCTATVLGRANRLWPLIAPRFPRRFWKATCSATSAEHLPGLLL